MKVAISAFIVSMLFSMTAAAGVTKWLDFELRGGHIVLPATVSGIPTHAILDSGAQFNAINTAFMGKHNLSYNRVGKIRVQGAFGEAVQDKLSGLPIALFGSETTFDQVVGLALGHHSRGLLLGAPLFYGNIMQIDYPGKRLRLVTRDAMALSEFTNIRMVDQKGSGMPLVQVTIEGKNIWLILDTGNSAGVVIERPLAQDMGLIKRENGIAGAQGATRRIDVESTRVKEMQFGPFTLENVLVSFNAEGNSIRLKNQYSETGTRINGKRVSGLIGFDVLKHFVLTMDYARGQMHVGLPEDE